MMEDKETLAEEKPEAEETATPEEVEAVATEDAQSDDKESKTEKKKAKKEEEESHKSKDPLRTEDGERRPQSGILEETQNSLPFSQKAFGKCRMDTIEIKAKIDRRDHTDTQSKKEGRQDIRELRDKARKDG